MADSVLYPTGSKIGRNCTYAIATRNWEEENPCIHSPGEQLVSILSLWFHSRLDVNILHKWHSVPLHQFFLGILLQSQTTRIGVFLSGHSSFFIAVYKNIIVYFSFNVNFMHTNVKINIIIHFCDTVPNEISTVIHTLHRYSYSHLYVSGHLDGKTKYNQSFP